MKTVSNKTQKPLSVPLPRGKILHLGPGKTGQISSEAAEHPRLKKLVEAGIFRKTAYRQRPLRHEYRLTDKGAALFTVIVGLKQWGDRFGAAARSGKPMDLVNRGDGRPLEPVLIDADSGQRLELTNVRAVAGPGADQGTRAFFERLAINRPPR